MTLTMIATFITEIGVLLGVVVFIFKKYKHTQGEAKLVAEGVKCLLRSEMLQIYYRHKDTGKIRQYEYENFIELYNGYKSLGGNSFIEKIYKEVQTWEIIS